MMLSNEILKSSELSIVDSLHYKDHGPLLYWLATERTPGSTLGVPLLVPPVSTLRLPL